MRHNVICGQQELYYILCYDLGRLYRKIKRADYDMPSQHWDTVSCGAKDLVRKLLHPDSKKRLNVETALKHKWLQPL